MKKMEEKFGGKKIAVMGFGAEGKSVVEFLLPFTTHITVYAESAFDEHDIKKFEALGVQFIFGSFPPVINAEIIFRSPGIHPHIATLLSSQKKGAIITSATQLFFELCPAPIIGVTGTKGKGTTSTLIYEMLQADGRDVYLGGNIGTAPFSFLSKVTEASFVVLELSSFQLMDLSQSPHIAVVLMTTQEHLNYHATIQEYVNAKSNIYTHQQSQDILIVNVDYSNNDSALTQHKGSLVEVSTERAVDQGCFVFHDAVSYIDGDSITTLFSVQDIALIGKHNVENVCAAVSVAKTLGVSDSVILHVISTFQGLPYRLENVGTINTVSFFNDSFSTIPETTIAAINSFTQPKVLILGGSSKGSDFHELGRLIKNDPSVVGIVGIGEEWKKIRETIGTSPHIEIVEGCTTMKEIIDAAIRIAPTNSVVLLSPACASFGLFKNYKDRGNQFREEVGKR